MDKLHQENNMIREGLEKQKKKLKLLIQNQEHLKKVFACLMALIYQGYADAEELKVQVENLKKGPILVH